MNAEVSFTPGTPSSYAPFVGVENLWSGAPFGQGLIYQTAVLLTRADTSDH
jgi:hypothetical protein